MEHSLLNAVVGVLGFLGLALLVGYVIHLAAKRNQAGVDYALGVLIDGEQLITSEAVEVILDSLEQIPSPTEVSVERIDLDAYDVLLSLGEEVQPCYQMN